MLYLFDVRETKKDRRTCVCQDADCKLLSKGFQNAEDARGGHISFPRPLDENDNRKKTAIRQEHRFNRTRAHLGNLPLERCLGVDNRDRTKVVLAVQAEREAMGLPAENKGPKRQSKYIASWHFHPRIFHDHIWNSARRSAVARPAGYIIPATYFKDQVFFAISGYTNEDRYPSDSGGMDGFPILPTYSSAQAWKDLKSVQNLRTANQPVVESQVSVTKGQKRQIVHDMDTKPAAVPGKKKRGRPKKDKSKEQQPQITWHQQKVQFDQRWKLNNHQGAVLWFTGMSASGKSSIANQVDAALNQKGIRTYLLDGDNIRHGLCKDLGFSLKDRAENIRRVGEVCKLMADSGVVVLAALISPYAADRNRVRATVEGTAFFGEIYVQASLETCEKRDPKGLYKMAREGKIKNFTGIDDPYEAPVKPDLVLQSDTKSITQLAMETFHWVEPKLKLGRK